MSKIPKKVSIRRLRKDAKKYKVEHDVKLTEAQNMLAKENGYHNWVALMRANTDKKVNYR